MFESTVKEVPCVCLFFFFFFFGGGGGVDGYVARGHVLVWIRPPELNAASISTLRHSHSHEHACTLITVVRTHKLNYVCTESPPPYIQFVSEFVCTS